MKNYFPILLLFICYYSSAQIVYNYSYDNAGNRISRSCAARMANPDPPKDSTGKDVATKYGISVFPNPTTQNINVVIAALTNGQSADVYLFDMQGKSLLSKKQTGEQETVAFNGLSSGVYQLKIVFNNEQVSYRIVKL